MKRVSSRIGTIAVILAAALITQAAQTVAPTARAGALLINLPAGRTYGRRSFAPDGRLTGRSILRTAADAALPDRAGDNPSPRAAADRK